MVVAALIILKYKDINKAECKSLNYYISNVKR